MGRDRGIGVASIQRFLVNEVVVRAEDVVGGKIEALGAGIGPTRRPTSHFLGKITGNGNSEDKGRWGGSGFRLRGERERKGG